MVWLTAPFVGVHETANAIAVLALVAVSGLTVGEAKVGAVKLATAGTLFIGIALSHLGFKTDMTILAFARDFGLLLFVYAIWPAAATSLAGRQFKTPRSALLLCPHSSGQSQG